MNGRFSRQLKFGRPHHQQLSKERIIPQSFTWHHNQLFMTKPTGQTWSSPYEGTPLHPPMQPMRLFLSLELVDQDNLFRLVNHNNVEVQTIERTFKKAHWRCIGCAKCKWFIQNFNRGQTSPPERKRNNIIISKGMKHSRAMDRAAHSKIFAVTIRLSITHLAKYRWSLKRYYLKI